MMSLPVWCHVSFRGVCLCGWQSVSRGGGSRGGGLCPEEVSVQGGLPPEGWSLFGGSGGSRISPRRGHQLPRGAPTYDFAKFSPKQHEIEIIWTPGGLASLVLPLDPPLGGFPSRGGSASLPTLDRMTHAYENITFPCGR